MAFVIMALLAVGVAVGVVFAFRRAGRLERAAEERQRLADRDDDWFERSLF
jgi:cbb3-type cytochrome oxidase subunit 3